MNEKLFKGTVAAVALTAALAIGALLGFQRGVSRGESKLFDRALMDLTTSILYRDALQSKRIDKIEPIVRANIEADFYYMIRYANSYHGPDVEKLRCAATKRVRKMRQDGLLLTNLSAFESEGVSAAEVATYLDSKCLGEPASLDWTLN